MCRDNPTRKNPILASEVQNMTLPDSSLSFTPENKEIIKEIVRKRLRNKDKAPVDYFSYLLLGLVVFLTVATYPAVLEGKVTIQHVWYNGWITAIATGCGVIPFFFLHEPSKFWMGVSNAIAGGMMIAASLSLVSEAINFEEGDFGVLALFPNIGEQLSSASTLFPSSSIYLPHSRPHTSCNVQNICWILSRNNLHLGDEEVSRPIRGLQRIRFQRSECAEDDPDHRRHDSPFSL